MAGGHGVNSAPTYTFRVVSNDNVATYIKELVLEPLPGSPKLEYQPGDYLQLTSGLPERSLQSVAVEAPYTAAAGAATVRSDRRQPRSLPAQLLHRFQSRWRGAVALQRAPGHGRPRPEQPYGVGSAYLFGLRPGEQVTAIGPFGDFHIRTMGAR